MKSKAHNKLKDEKGQVSIFLSITMIIVFTLIAFVTNVGLFVKAKINLQNAVDSAAWSGAAVQARQLSNIGYVNWEMRNTFKEWMFKYYVMGQMSNTKTHPGSLTGDRVDFRLKRFDSAGTSFGDRYNLPSICIHFGSSHNICDVYQVPGLPRFKVAGLPNVSEQFESAVNAFVAQKAKNCSDRTAYNFAAAMNYAFSTKRQSLTDVPIVAAYRAGAWMQSMELALRMRNLEMILNRPPISDGICINGCTENETTLNQGNSSYGYAINERPYKAFKAAIRTLGGGTKKSLPEDGYVGSFKLYELPPKPYQGAPTALSNFLIPQGATFENVGGTPVIQKHYGDLVPMIFNYATFFSTFAANSGSSDEINVAAGTPMEAACASSKTALPVPGYILGFYKNPQVLTYYAVKGEANFMGLMNPFGNAINLKAYAAAKPFGGRVGPILVKVNQPTDFKGATLNFPRTAGGQPGRTSSYVFGFNTGADPRATPTGDKAGLPIPSSPGFYIQNESDPIGGVPTAISSNMRFSIPNMIYTFPSGGSALTNDIIPQTTFYTSPNVSTDETAGLYNMEQYQALRKALPPGVETQATMDQEQIEKAIENARAPTRYDALNYMIPTVKIPEMGEDTEGYETLKPLAGQTNPLTGSDLYAYFAPLFGNGTLYKNDATIIDVLSDYIGSLSNSVTAYNEALKDYADQMRAQPTTDPTAYQAAADGIHKDLPAPENAPFPDCNNLSIAAKFNHFFTSEDLVANADNCDILPLKASVKDYIVGVAGDTTQAMFYVTTFAKPDAQNNEALTNDVLSTAFLPGPQQGADPEGVVSNPLNPGGAGTSARRNYYSTKFVAVEALRDSSSGYMGQFQYVETDGTSNPATNPRNPTDFNGSQIVNFLDVSDLSEFGDLNF
jgi:hypothetical protein